MKANEIIIGQTYRLRGDLQNGAFVTKEDVVREVTRMTDTHIYCQCGRVFIINENLNIDPFPKTGRE